MHVLIVNQYGLPAGAPGITRHGDLGRELVRHGHQVSVIASAFNYLTRAVASERESTERHDGVTFRWLHTGSYEANDRRRLRSMLNFSFRATLLGMRMRPRPSIVIGSSPHLLAGISAWLIARWHRVPFVLEIRDPWPSALVDLGAISAGSLSHRLLEQVERFVYHHADRIVTVMEHADLRVAEVGEDPRKCVHIPNASAVPSTYAALPSAFADVLTHEEEAGRRVVLYTGAHGVSNGLMDVLAALDQLRQRDEPRYDRLALLLVGGGSEKPALIDRAREAGHSHVHFLDPVPKDQILSGMRRADFVLVHFAAADFKRFGMSANKLFDAMAVARPVLVATTLTDTPVDVVGCGFRYQPGSASALADVLAMAVDCADAELEAMGTRGQAEMRRRYTLEVTGRQLSDLVVELGGTPRPNEPA